MISKEKVNILIELTRYDKKYRDKDFRINQFTREDYVSNQTIKMGVCLTAAYLGILGILAIIQLDVVISLLREGTIFVPIVIASVIYAGIFWAYFRFTRRVANREYHDAQSRIKIYDKHLKDLEDYYEKQDMQDTSPTIESEENDDGDIINR